MFNLSKQRLKCFLGFHNELKFHVGGADGYTCYHCLKTIVTKDLHTNKIFMDKEDYIICSRFGKVKPIWFCYTFCGKYLGDNRCGEKIPEPQSINYSYVLWTNRMATFGGHLPY